MESGEQGAGSVGGGGGYFGRSYIRTPFVLWLRQPRAVKISDDCTFDKRSTFRSKSRESFVWNRKSRGPVRQQTLSQITLATCVWRCKCVAPTAGIILRYNWGNFEGTCMNIQYLYSVANHLKQSTESTEERWRMIRIKTSQIYKCYTRYIHVYSLQFLCCWRRTGALKVKKKRTRSKAKIKVWNQYTLIITALQSGIAFGFTFTCMRMEYCTKNLKSTVTIATALAFKNCTKPLWLICKTET